MFNQILDLNLGLYNSGTVKEIQSLWEVVNWSWEEWLLLSTILTNVSGLQVNVMHRQFSFIACQYRRHFPISSR